LRQKNVVSDHFQWHRSYVNNVVVSNNAGAQAIKAEARQLRRAGKRIAASRTATLRLLAATGMYTIKGELKPQFR
jgi:hypothetical protein